MGHVACRTRYAIKQSLHSWQQVWHTNFLCSQPNETLTEKRFRKNSFYYTVVEKERCCLPFVPPAPPPAQQESTGCVRTCAVFFFPVTPQSARDTQFFWILSRVHLTFHGHFFENCHGQNQKCHGHFFRKVSRVNWKCHRLFEKSCHGQFTVCHGHFCVLISFFFNLELSHQRWFLESHLSQVYYF